MAVTGAAIYGVEGTLERRYTVIKNDRYYVVMRRLPFHEYWQYYHRSSVDEIILDQGMYHWLVLSKVKRLEAAKTYLGHIITTFEMSKPLSSEPGEGIFVHEPQILADTSSRERENTYG